MTDNSFLQKVDAMADSSKARTAAAEREAIEKSLPVLESILALGKPAVDAIDVVLEKVPANEPGMTAIRQTRQVINHTLREEYARLTQRLAELTSNATPSEEE